MIEQAQINTLLSNALRRHVSGDFLSAEKLYREVILKSPHNAKAKHFLGFLLQQTDQLPEALEQLNAAIALDDSHADWHFNLGVVLARQKQTLAAIEAFSKAIAIDSKQYFYWTNLGTVLESNAQWKQAEHCYKRAIEIDPDHPDAFYLLSALCLKLKRFEDARHFNYRGIVAAPVESTSKINLGQAYYALGQVDKAIQVFEEIISKDPENSIASHLLTICYGKKIPEQCSNEFVELTFDMAANNFEKTLRALNYSGPQLVKDFLLSNHFRPASLSILDLGCGTGMVGEMLRPYATSLTGVDLSQAMLDQAKTKHIYNELYKNDIVEFLKTNTTQYDLVSCMDTFVYLGNLEKIFHEIHRHLKVGGLLMFSTERTESDNNYQLNISGRYSHSENYLKELLKIHHFKILAIHDMIVRMEAGYPLPGQFICVSRVIKHSSTNL